MRNASDNEKITYLQFDVLPKVQPITTQQGRCCEFVGCPKPDSSPLGRTERSPGMLSDAAQAWSLCLVQGTGISIT